MLVLIAIGVWLLVLGAAPQILLNLARLLDLLIGIAFSVGAVVVAYALIVRALE